MASSALAKRLRSKTFTIGPGVFEMISTRIADSMGFDCLYMTGYGAVASSLGLPDAGLATYSDMVGVVDDGDRVGDLAERDESFEFLLADERAGDEQVGSN